MPPSFNPLTRATTLFPFSLLKLPWEYRPSLSPLRQLYQGYGFSSPEVTQARSSSPKPPIPYFLHLSDQERGLMSTLLLDGLHPYH